MYKVLLVDDEINILEGIAAVVDWKACEVKLMAKASNGVEAFELIEKDMPDIVITDIKMPGMNGVELIKKAHAAYPSIKWMILSGHDEFEFAKSAMEHNVRHYLLKPSNEKKIEAALTDIVSELNDQNANDLFVQNMKKRLQQIMPKAKAQILKEVLSDNSFGTLEWDHFQQLFGSDYTSEPLKLLVLQIDDLVDKKKVAGPAEFEHFFALKEIVTEKMEQTQTILLSTTIGEKVVLVIESESDQVLIKTLKEVKEDFLYFYQLTFTSAISSEENVTQLRRMYREALQGLAQRFYVGSGGIISTGEIAEQGFRFDELQFNHEDLLMYLRSGNLEETKEYLDEYFAYVSRMKYDVSIVKAHSLELFMSIIRQTKKEVMESLFKQVIHFQQFQTLKQVEEFIYEAAISVAQENYTSTKQRLSSTIHQVCEYVDSHYSDSDLSLLQLSNDIFYMNSDYLGKLFKKEVGEKFSNYLVKLRIDKAIESIQKSEQLKISEIAEQVGFGNNPRYFSQVFKKQTGFTPSEYKENNFSTSDH
ncbi:response regulator [Alkalicoccobacillus murimartini]|uniref:Two-component system response regulator YesN n=1 Tax=Alkalicoccobacillus murimartini TaxID=171685 RepID=A0ABT9YKD5_9BACI|nr:response regulator [Alkalicoccobacillus murimartini]MDQ0208196.1 two-component system response regulator YesN [Alkalicoccobacillus murimartini]